MAAVSPLHNGPRRPTSRGMTTSGRRQSVWSDECEGAAVAGTVKSEVVRSESVPRAAVQKAADSILRECSKQRQMDGRSESSANAPLAATCAASPDAQRVS